MTGGDELRLTNTPFDVEQLPFARGPADYFVGEYEGLTSTGNVFRPLFAIGTGNRLTDLVTATAGLRPLSDHERASRHNATNAPHSPRGASKNRTRRPLVLGARTRRASVTRVVGTPRLHRHRHAGRRS